MFDDGVENTNLGESVGLDVGVELAALVLDEEHNKLKVGILF
jgi:hypothetical protein